MEIIVWIYVASTVLAMLGSLFEWKTEVDHKGWTKQQYFISCFVPISNTSYAVSMFVALFKWLNRSC